MKKRLKTCLAILFSFVLMINTISISAEMSENDINQDLPTVESEQNTEEVQNTDVEDSQDSDTSDISNLNDDIEVTEESSQEETNQEVTETEQEVTESEQDNTSEVTSAEESTAKGVTTEEAAFDETEEAATEASEVESVNMPEFSRFKIVDGVIVLVTAPEGVFLEGSTLSVAKVNEEEQKDVDDAVDKTRDENLNVAVSYTYDIKVLDNNGNEIQPADGQKVNVSFALEETANENLNADVYHITEENGELAAEVLETSEQGSLVIAESDGFSYYTVEFTYNEKQYVMQGDSEVALTDILSFVGITNADGSPAADSDITVVAVSNESLFSASKEGGAWMVTAHQAFASTEWIKVTVDGVEYEIVVTDAEAQYRINVTVSKVEFDKGSSNWYFSGVTIKTDNNWFYSLPASCTYDSNTEPASIFLNVALTTGALPESYCADVPISSTSAILSKRSNNYSYSPVNVTIEYSVSVTELHSHSWSYSADGNEIFATCNGSGTCPVGDQTLTLSTVSNKTYNGSAQTVPTYTTTDGWKTENGLEEPGTVTVSPANSANAGTYTASVSAGNATAQSSWTISKADITPSVTMNGWTYGANANSPSVSGNAGNGTVTYEYKVSTAADSTYSTNKPSNAGTYTVKAEIASTTNYNAGTATENFTISKAAGNISYSTTSLTKTYGDSTFTNALTKTGDGVASYSSSDTSVATIDNNGKVTILKAGTTTITATVSDGTNYSYASRKATYSLTVNKKAITIKANDQTITYGGTITTNTGKVTVNTLKSGDILTSITLTPSTSVATTNGTITPSKAVIKNDNTDVTDNYDISYTTGKLVINKADISPEVNITGWTYGEYSSEINSPSVTGNTGNGNVTYEYKVKDALDDTYTETVPSKAGNYTVRATIATTSNYNGGTATTDFIISTASMSVTANGYSGTYDGYAHGITVNVPESAVVKYGTSDGNYPETTSPSYTDVGTYTVYYQVTKQNYTAVTGSATVQINPKELTLNWSTNNTFTYNGSQQVPTAMISGVINGDDCTVIVNGAKTDYSASSYTATAVLDGAKKGNYKLPTENTKPFTIGKKDATITASNQTITYGEAIATGTGYITTDDFVSEDLPTAITLTQSTSDVTSNGTITPSAATIKKGDTDVTDNYNITYDTGNLTINKKPITISGITASNKTYDGTTTATLNYNGINWTECGMVAGDDLSVTATGTFSDANVGTGKTVTITGLTLGGTKAGNYELAESGQQTSTTANINAKAITITADSDSKVYDGTAHTKNSHSITNGELATGDSIESVTVTGSQTFVGNSNNVPGAAVIKNSSGVDVTGNYDITYTNGTLTVTKKPLTITADSAEKVYDTTPLTTDRYTYTELAEGDSISSVTVTGSRTSVGESYNVPRDAVIKKGEVDVTENYLISYVNGVLKVTKKTVTITANSDTKIYDGTALTNDNYTVSGLENDDRVDSVTITGTQTIVGESTNVPSEAVIKNAANEDVNENYSISYNNGTLKVTKKPITITANSDSKVYDGTALTKNGYTNSELADGDRIESVTITGTQTVAGESANVPSAAVIKNANGEDVTASYDITYVEGTLKVTKKAVTITADDAKKVYDGTPLTKNSYTNSELSDGDRIESVTITGSQTVVGESASVPSEAVIKNANGDDVTASYNITYENGTLEVTKRPITIDGIAAEDKIFDGTTDAELDYSDIDWSACGMVDGDELSVTATGTYENSNAGTDKNVIITDITLDGESIDNYVLADAGQQTTAVATINKKAVTVTALKQTVAVNGEIENSIEYAVLSGALEGHELAEITLTSGSTAKTTTEGVITPSEAKIVNGDTDVTDNYDISYIDGIMTVTKAEAEVVLDNGDDEAPASVTAVEVPNLLELADEEAEEGKLVKVELSVKPVSENNVSSTTVSDVKKAVESLFAFVDMESVKVEYLEIDLTKYVDNVKESAISDTGAPLEIILTYDTSKAGNPVIIRNHEGTVTVFTQLSSRPTGNLTDATYYVEGNKIYMYSQYFSDFAIAYSVEKTFNVILDDGNGNIIRQIVSEGTKFIPPTDITKDGYNLDGWYKDETFTEKWNTEKDKVASDIKLFAKWTKKAEPAKVETPKADTPKAPATGDKMNIGVIVILMIGSALAALYLTLRRRLMK